MTSVRQINLARIHLRHLVALCKYSRIEITETTFLRLHDTLPGTVEEAEDGMLLQECYFWQLLQITKQYRLNPSQQGDVSAATKYAFDEWPRYTEEVKTQIRTEISTLLQ